MTSHFFDRRHVSDSFYGGFRLAVLLRNQANLSFSALCSFLIDKIRPFARLGLILLATIAFTLPGKTAVALNVSLSTGDLHYTDAQGNTMPYRLYIPPGYNAPGAEFPLIIFLHGSGESGTDNTAPSNGYIDNIYNAAHGNYGAQYKAFLLVPQTQWGWQYYPDYPADVGQTLALDILNLVNSTYQVDDRRLYVTGLSMGGFGSFDFIANHPKMFAAASPLSGGGDPLEAPIIKDIPIWAYHGTADTVVPVDYTDEMYDAIEAVGGHMEYTRVSGVGHGGWETFYNGSTYKNSTGKTLYQWMFAQSLPVPEPSFFTLGAGALGFGLVFWIRRRFSRPFSPNHSL
jgi:predicted peptidase